MIERPAPQSSEDHVGKTESGTRGSYSDRGCFVHPPAVVHQLSHGRSPENLSSNNCSYYDEMEMGDIGVDNDRYTTTKLTKEWSNKTLLSV